MATKPILFFAVEAIRSRGISEIHVIVGDTADEVRAALPVVCRECHPASCHVKPGDNSEAETI